MRIRITTCKSLSHREISPLNCDLHLIVHRRLWLVSHRLHLASPACHHLHVTTCMSSPLHVITCLSSPASHHPTISCWPSSVGKYLEILDSKEPANTEWPQVSSIFDDKYITFDSTLSLRNIYSIRHRHCFFYFRDIIPNIIPSRKPKGILF